MEGSAAGLESRVYPDLDDIVAALQTRDWYLHPDRPITEQSYAAQLLWRWLDARYPRLLPAFLERLGEHPAGGDGGRAFATTFARETGRHFASVFPRFAEAVAEDHPARIRPHAVLRRAAGYAGSVAPYAVHYLRLPLTARRVSVSFRGRVHTAALTYRVASDVAGNAAIFHRIEPRADGRGGLTFRMPGHLGRRGRTSALTLTISNGWPRARLDYRVTVR
jgi:hypothetical protein